jgi:hypothetical protein
VWLQQLHSLCLDLSSQLARWSKHQRPDGAASRLQTNKNAMEMLYVTLHM